MHVPIDYFASIEPLQEKTAEKFSREVNDSLERQVEIEVGDDIGLDEYLGNYFNSGQ